MNVESISPTTSIAKISSARRTQLIIDHVEIATKLAWKLLNSWQAKLNQDDVKSLVGIALCEAANNYDGRPNVQFQTFLYYYLRGRLLREITESVKSKNLSQHFSQLDIHDNLQQDSMYEDLQECCSTSELKTAEQILLENEQQAIIDESFDSLDHLEKEIVNRHYLEGESLIDLAEELGYCRCHLSRVKRRALSKLKYSIAKKFDDADNLTQNIESADAYAEKGSSYTGGRGRRKSAKIKSTSREAKKLAA